MIDLLAIGVHPDDVELHCAGILLSHKAQGYSTAIIDMTKGEMGTNGSPEKRKEEATKAAEILDVDYRINLGLADAFFENSKENQAILIEAIRRFRPKIVLLPALHDRHPDHGRGADLCRDAVFYAGLKKIETTYNGEEQEAFRPPKSYHYIQDRYIEPELVVDITPYWEKKLKSIYAYDTQFHDPTLKSNNETTYISRPQYLDFIEGRARQMGHFIGTIYGEGLVSEQKIGTNNLFNLG